MGYYSYKHRKTIRLSAKQVITIRIAGLCGITSQIVGFTVVLVAISRYSSFSWTENYLSVLGATGSTSALFNYGLMAVGILSLLFAIGLSRSGLLKERMGQAGIICLALGSIAMGIIGIFPRTTGAPHDAASLAFYAFTPLALFLIGAGIMTSAEKRLGLLAFAASILTIALVLVPWPWNGGAIPQALSYLPWSLWSIGFGTKLLIRPE